MRPPTTPPPASAPNGPGVGTGPADGGFDKVSALMALVASVALAWAAWLRFGPGPEAAPPPLGTPAPALRLRDPATAEPLVLLGLHGRVVWLTFWSAGPPSGPTDLADLEAVWTRLKSRPRFAMAALAADPGRPELLRAAVAATKATLPAYPASPETVRSYGATPAHLPLHVLIDADGRVGAVAQGRGPATLARLAAQATRWLDELEPLGKTRFAARSRPPPPGRDSGHAD